MRDYSVVTPAFWIGSTGKKLRGDMEAQLLAVYLMTSPHSTMTGVFHCPVLYMAHETGIPLEGASKALARLIEAGFCEYEEATETVFVVRMACYQIADHLKPGDNRIAGLKKDIAKMGSVHMRKRFLATHSEAFCLKVDSPEMVKTGQKDSPSKAPRKPLPSQEQEQEQEQDKDSPELLAHSEQPLTDFSIPLVDSTVYQVPVKEFEMWTQAYPAVNVGQELLQMAAWVSANPTKRKTRRGVAAFAVRWLSKAQDLPSGRSPPTTVGGILPGAI